MSSCWVELWAACSVSANASLALRSGLVSLAPTIVLMVVSDRYGRKKVLLATMTGNILSAVVWLRSTTFVSLTMPPELNVGFFPALSPDWRAQRRKRPTQYGHHRRRHRDRDEVKVPCSDWYRLLSLLHLRVRPLQTYQV